MGWSNEGAGREIAFEGEEVSEDTLGNAGALALER